MEEESLIVESKSTPASGYRGTTPETDEKSNETEKKRKRTGGGGIGSNVRDNKKNKNTKSTTPKAGSSSPPPLPSPPPPELPVSFYPEAIEKSLENLLQKFRDRKTCGLKPIIGVDESGIADFTVHHEGDGKKFSVHSCLLLYQSQYFRGLKTSQMSENNENTMTIRKDPKLGDSLCSSSEFELLLHCIYSPDRFVDDLVRYCMIPDDADADAVHSSAVVVAKGGKEEEEGGGGIEGIEGMVVIGSGTVGRDDDDRDSGFLQNTQLAASPPIPPPSSPDTVSKEDPREELLMFAVERLLTISEIYGVDFIKNEIKLRILLSPKEPITFEWLHRKYPFFVLRMNTRFRIFAQEYEKDAYFLQKYLDDSLLSIPDKVGKITLYDDAKYARKLPSDDLSSNSNNEFAPDVLGPTAATASLKWLQNANLHLENESRETIPGRDQFDLWIRDVTEGGESGALTLKRTLGNMALIQNVMLKKCVFLRKKLTAILLANPYTTLRSDIRRMLLMLENLLDLMDPTVSSETVARQFSTMSKLYESQSSHERPILRRRRRRK